MADKPTYSKSHLEVDDIYTFMAIPSRGPTHVNWCMSMLNMRWPINQSTKRGIIVGEDVAQARNNFVLEAQAVDAKYLFFVDDDVLVPPNTPIELINQMDRHPEWDMLTGVYVTKTDPPEPVLFGGKVGSAGVHWDWEIGTQFPVWASGMGCALIRMTAFDKFPAPWFAFTHEAEGVTSKEEGEDIYFCRKLMEAGGTIMADGSILCGHVNIQTNEIFQLPYDSPPVRNAPKQLRDQFPVSKASKPE